MHMTERGSRRQFLAGLAGVGSLAVGGCTVQAPRNQADLPPLGDDFETDTAGDGIPDPLVDRMEGGESASPYRKNVFVEVERVEGTAYEEMLAFATKVFERAPVENPDGSTGIDLHFVVDGPPVPEESAPLSTPEFHFQHTKASVFDRRHRGFRHLVVLDERYGDDWYADPFVMSVETGRTARLVDVLAAHLAGRFDPLVPVADTAATDQASSGADERLWLPDQREATVDELIEAIDWDLVEAGLPQTTPSTRWYEQKYAHVPPDSEVEPPDESEIELGPTPDQPDKDTSGDGIADELLLTADVFEDADPLRKNVFVEADYQNTIERETVARQLEEARQVFAQAPIRNPDGSMGIDLHYVIDDRLEIDGTVSNQDLDQIEREQFDRHLRGHFYMLFIQDAADALGFATNQAKTLVAEPSPTTPLHELGHAVGLGSIYLGVDQTRYSFAEYPSVMNYNAPRYATVFADETGHPEAANDWEIIERRLPRDQALTSLL